MIRKLPEPKTIVLCDYCGDVHIHQFVCERLKWLARKRIEKALEYGKITKPDRCQECGKKGYVEGHHDDYEQALVVRWLCRACHGVVRILTV